MLGYYPKSQRVEARKFFVSYGLCSGSYLVAKAGDWILKTDNDQRTLTVMSDEAFCAEYGIIDAEYQVLAP